jgi:hypothetical protein
VSSNGEEEQYIKGADGVRTLCRVWWEGDRHKSWLVGGKKFGGGDFESTRYLENDFYVCDTCFHPTTKGKKDVCIKWTYERQ